MVYISSSPHVCILSKKNHEFIHQQTCSFAIESWDLIHAPIRFQWHPPGNQRHLSELS
uniref:Uncharacterized protein n=1 Tax=Nelumbo nucifera TaxID=4432 RepID=A0A822XUA7_NELNU|nr:TPA_asm: hypothetical protein HUJ06_022481 [Nelumbo nucifera]